VQVGIVGAGHVGLTTAVCLAHCGHQVVVVDSDQERVQGLNRGQLPFFEPGLPELFRRTGESLRFTTEYEELADASICMIAVPSPTSSSGGVDLSFVRSAAAGLGKALLGRQSEAPMLIVNKCTVPVGTAQLVTELIRARHSGAPEVDGATIGAFTVASCPEFLREGMAVPDTLYPDRLVFGVNSEAAAQVLQEVYGPIVRRSFSPIPALSTTRSTGPKVMITSVTTAELIKYAANAFLATKLSFINELASLSSAVGASIDEVADGIGLDHRIGRQFLNAGIGWGGSCLGKDLQALIGTAREYELRTPILEAVVEVNERQRGVVVRLLHEELHVLKGRRIALLGLAFKPGTDDLRDAPSLEIARRLVALGAMVTGYDPVVKEVPVAGLSVVDSVAEAARDADAMVLLTEWDEFRDLPWIMLGESMRHRILIDGRNLIPAGGLAAAGFRHRGIGR
jgi:UDPglucose 6-dehydrogenase